MDSKKLWSDLQEAVKSAINNDISYTVHIKPSEGIDYNNSVFTIAVPTSINRNMIEFRFKNTIESVLEAHFGQKTKLNIILEYEKDIFNSEDDTETFYPDNIVLNGKYTFENFVIGTSNEYAATAAISASENPGHIYNPLFFYGNSGLGKTHLMCAMGNKIKRENPKLKVLYVTTETFTNEFVDCIKNHKMNMFRKKYRTIDVLLIDDVQFLINREGIQEEFFHTFNDLYTLNKQIVLTSDRKPSDLVTLEDRLKTRFTQGLNIDITVPNYETRLAILRKKSEENQYNIPDEILEYIAKRIKSNVRELEGALLKLISLAQLKKMDIDMELTQYTIDSILPKDGIVKITPDKIMDRICSLYNVTKDELIGKSRIKNLVVPRQVAMYLCSKLTDMNSAMIGRNFGGKDRSTVIYTVQKIEKLLEKDSDLKTNIDYIIKDLQSI